MHGQKEIIDSFVAEMKEIHSQLKGIVEQQLKNAKMDLPLFENFGQLIDRLYGTAMTLGYTSVGQYFLAIKEVSYMSSQCNHVVGQKKALRMMIECTDNMEKICRCIHKKEELKSLDRLFIVEIAKVDRLSKTDFQSIKRKSVA